MSGRRLDVTATQAVSSMLATITGAIAASSLGIAGTIIGAAFMSLATTVGAAVYRLYLARSNERLRAAAASLAPKASGSTVAAAVVRRHTGHGRVGSALAHQAADQAESPAAASEATARRAAPPRYSRDEAEAADSAQTQVIPALTGRRNGQVSADASDLTRFHEPDVTGELGPGAGRDLPGAGREPAPGATQDLGAGATQKLGAGPTQDLGPARPAESVQPTEDVTRTWFRDTAPRAGTGPGAGATTASPGPGTGASGGGEGPAGRRGGRRRWLVMGLAALGVFVVAMGAISAFEAIAGKPLETVIWHKKGSGTTVGGLVGGPARHHQPKPGGSTSPTGSPSTPASPSTTPTPTPTNSGSGTPAPTPSATSSSPAAPAPTGSGAAGTSASPGPNSP
jgi:hypothetical protein